MSYVTALWEAMPEDSLLIVAGLHGNFLGAAQHFKRRQVTEGWSMDDDLALQGVVDAARTSRAAFAVKPRLPLLQRAEALAQQASPTPATPPATPASEAVPPATPPKAEPAAVGSEVTPP